VRGRVENGGCMMLKGMRRSMLLAAAVGCSMAFTSKRISIALAVTFKPSSYDYQTAAAGGYWTTGLYYQLGKILAPHNPPLIP
jgi:hypothetical protein